jgi:hypothetical protein
MTSGILSLVTSSSHITSNHHHPTLQDGQTSLRTTGDPIGDHTLIAFVHLMPTRFLSSSLQYLSDPLYWERTIFAGEDAILRITMMV